MRPTCTNPLPSLYSEWNASTVVYGRVNTIACLIWEALAAQGKRINPTALDETVLAHIKVRG